MKKILFFCSILLLHASLASAKFDPAFIWNTLETPHFRVHYHQGEEDLAQRAAVIAEDVHRRLASRIKWEPKGRTEVVLVDSMDDSNGMSTPMPYNQMILFVNQPVGEPGFGTTAYDEWLRMLIMHEYTHILQLDMITGGLGSVFQTMFGRLYFPNALQPIWMIEGLAVYEETEQTSGGRNRSPGAEMVIRMAVLEDRFPSLGQAAVYPDSWPAGNVPYLFGGSFTRYIAGKYGRDALADISLVYSGRGIPFLVGSTGNRVLHRDYSDLWEEWHRDLASQYSKVRDELAAKGLTASLALTSRGFVNGSPSVSPDGTRIAYVVSNNDTFPSIHIMNSDGTGDRLLVENLYADAAGNAIAWGPDGQGIYYTKLEVRRNTNLYNDIYYYDLKQGREVRVTKGLRARDPFPSMDGKRLLFVTTRLGRTRLAQLRDPQSRTTPAQEADVVTLIEESRDQYETPRFSPDGSLISIGVWQPGGYKDLWLLDSEGRKVNEVTHDRALDGGASWSPDGKVLYFSSDRTGIFNLYAYELASKRTFQVTNVLGGAFSPTLSPNGQQLLFTSYSSRGYDIHMRPVEPSAWKPAEPAQDRYPVVVYEDKPVETTTRSYDPLPSLVPRFWIPWFDYNGHDGLMPGGLTYAFDPAERHAYLAEAFYGPKNHRKEYAFAYAYDGLYPTITVAASDLDKTYSNLLTDATATSDYVERDRNLGISIVVPLIRMQTQHALTFGYLQTRLSHLTTLPPWSGYSGPLPSEGVLASGRISYSFNSSRQYGFSISPEEGRLVEVGYQRFDKGLGGDFTFDKYTIDWHEYLNLPIQHHVIQARAFAGTSNGDVITQRPFQVGGDALIGNLLDTSLGVTDGDIYLRGYPANAFRGRKAALVSLEYRFPIMNIEAGTGTAPFFFRRLHGAVFSESGNAWDNTLHGSTFKSSVGAEVRLDTYFAYRVPITVRLGIAQGLNAKGETMLIIGLWMPSFF